MAMFVGSVSGFSVYPLICVSVPSLTPYLLDYCSFAGILVETAVNLYIDLGRIDMFTRLSVPINEHSMLFYLLRMLGGKEHRDVVDSGD